MKHIPGVKLRLTRTLKASAIGSTIALLLGSPAIAVAGALPSGGHFVAGSGSITGDANTLSISQTSARGVIDWNSFSIASDHRVTIDNGSGATLNRVTGGNTSFILGKLSATGSVYLINPQGVVVGSGGVVSTGGRFVASTLDVDNASFMSGGALTFSGPSTRRIVNLGKIGSTHGDIFLISAEEVDNFGSIAAPNGSAELATGKTVLLRDSSTGQQVFVQTGSHGNIVNSGTIEAAQASLQAADGNIYALSGNHAAIRATGTATRDGHVWLVADTGGITIAQPLAAHNANGAGGTVDTNAAGFAFVGAMPTVLAGLWNVTTPSMIVDQAATNLFARSLNAGTSVNLQTTGALGRSGDIDVASSIRWTGAASLTLGAYRTASVDTDATIANVGSGNLTLRGDATAIDNAGSVFNLGTLDWSKSTGIATLLYDMNASYVAGNQLRNSAWTAPQFSGLQTQMTAYQLINSLTDLNALQGPQANYAGNYALGRDIDGQDNGNLGPAVGVGNQQNYVFTGQFDGMGHKVYNAFVAQGFFDTIGKTGVVRDFSVEDAHASMWTAETSEGAAILARDNQGLISRVYVSGGVDTNGVVGGGVAASNEGRIERAGSGASLTVYGSAGGLVGQNDGQIVQSYATGDIFGFSNGVAESIANSGGLVGVNNGTISQSYATGNLSATQWETDSGGLVGVNHGSINQSFATGAVVGLWWDPHYPAEVGGIATGDGTIAHDVYWNAQTSGQSYGGPGLPDANGLTTAQMSDPASFAGWNFGPGGVWAMPSGATHPVLAWQVGGP